MRGRAGAGERPWVSLALENQLFRLVFWLGPGRRAGERDISWDSGCPWQLGGQCGVRYVFSGQHCLSSLFRKFFLGGGVLCSFCPGPHHSFLPLLMHLRI